MLLEEQGNGGGGGDGYDGEWCACGKCQPLIFEAIEIVKTEIAQRTVDPKCFIWTYAKFHVALQLLGNMLFQGYKDAAIANGDDFSQLKSTLSLFVQARTSDVGEGVVTMLDHEHDFVLPHIKELAKQLKAATKGKL